MAGGMRGQEGEQTSESVWILLAVGETELGLQ